ncbi:MAG: YbaN family protein [Sphingopyxis sp.]|uniref:YbaN family protein n=1 Tax=Sphingopyxis sp. TaxID=1908224 RepID=UPI002AB8DB78|nr:YbaN family protein [Sphingopyxis sp.]MDZ3831252.1 YbaN family protein [Sphingopyxis sp.]
MKRHFYFVCGCLSLALGGIGAVLPLLPTVPFIILAAFCFARSSPKLEAWLVHHPSFGPHIVAWRDKGAISRKGKVAGLLGFAFSILISLVLAPWPWMLVPVVAAVIGGSWIWTRPEE